MGEWMDGWMDGWMLMNKWMITGEVDGWINGWMDVDE